MGEETKATGMPRGIPVPKNLENRQEQFFRKKGGGENHATAVQRGQGGRRETQKETKILAGPEERQLMLWKAINSLI